MKPYHILISSDPDYDTLVREIYVNDKFVALVTSTNTGLRVDFPGPDQYEPAIARQVDLDVLLQALSEAKELFAKDSYYPIEPK